MSCILIVDDSNTARAVMAKQLKTRGYDVIEARDGKEVLEKIKINNPDCMVLDLLMPEMDGLDVLKAMKNESLITPVIILSADI